VVATAVAAGGGQHLGGQVDPEDAAARTDRRPQVREGPPGAAAGVEGGLPGRQAELGHGRRIRRVIIGEPLLPGRGPWGEEGAGLGQQHARAEAAGQHRVHAPDDRPARVVDVHHDVGDRLGIDLGEVAGGGRRPAAVVAPPPAPPGAGG
jgi:hypothetical protein